MQGLTIGRIVWIYHQMTSSRRPGIVTRVIDKDTGKIGVHVFLDPNDPPGEEINSQGEAGVYTYSDSDQPCSWYWPKRD